MGLFDGIQNAGGIGGLFSSANQSLTPFTQNNQQALLGAGLALMGGEGYGGAARGFMAGAEGDRRAREQQLVNQMRQQQFQNQQLQFQQAQEDRQQERGTRNKTQEFFGKIYAGTELENAPIALQMADYTARRKQTSPKLPAAVQQYEYAKGQGFDGSFMDYQTALKKAGATNITMNNEQSKAAGFADRMMQSEQILQQTEEAGLDFFDRSASGVPVVGNYLTSDEYKSFEQAKRDFVNAILRRESGAVISDQEFDNADKQYFPQPGDTPEVIAQKRRNRQQAISGIARAAGSAYEPALIPTPDQSQQSDPLGIR